MATIADSLVDTIDTNYGGLGGGGTKPDNIVHINTLKGEYPWNEDSVLVWLPVSCERRPVNDDYVDLIYRVSVYVHTQTSDTRLYEIVDEVRRIINTNAVTNINYQTVEHEEDLTDRRGPFYRYRLDVKMVRYMLSSASSFSGSLSVGANAVLVDGSRPLTADWDAGSFEIRAQTFESDVTTGTAPFTVASTTKVTNLNADQVDGYDLDQSVKTTDSPAFAGLTVNGNITVTGTVDGVDVDALKTDVDGFPDELKNLVTAEIQQLENIGATTISSTQWSYLGELDQSLKQSASPTFAGLTLVNAITEFSTDGTLAGNSDSAVPTEKAVKTYVDTEIMFKDQLTELNDVEILSVTDNEFLAYDSASGKWKNQTRAEAGIADSDIDHDSLSGFVADEHVAHSGVSVIAGTALTGGGTIDSNVTLNVDETAINHDNLNGFVANEHIDHSAVSIIAGTALTGGGTITADRTLNVDDVEVVFHSDVDDVPVDGATTMPISSNWAYDHKADASAHHTKYTDADARAAVVSDVAYDATWDGVTTYAPSKNTVYDKIESLDADWQADINSSILTHANDVDAHGAGHSDLVDTTMTGAQDEDATSFGSANKEWYPTVWGMARLNSEVDIALTSIRNTGSDFLIHAILPIPTNKGSLKLYITGIKYGLTDADASNYVDQVRITAVKYGSSNTFYDNTTNQTTVGEKSDTFTAVDVSGYDNVIILINVICATAGNFEMLPPLLQCYYA